MTRLVLSALISLAALSFAATAEADVVPECPEGSQPEALGGEWNHGGFRCVNEDGEEVTEDDGGGLCAVGGHPVGGLVPVALSIVVLLAVRRRAGD